MRVFVRFAQVGLAGFLVDWAFLTLFLWSGTGFVIGRALSYIFAASATWLLNRLWTFRSEDRSILRQWLKFLLTNSVGGAINYLASLGMSFLLPLQVSSYPVIAIAVGSVAGMIINFILSKRFVFAPGAGTEPSA